MQTWTTADGLPVNYINHVAQAPDGYLWLATAGGLVRFDGLSFTAFARDDLKEWTSSFVETLFVTDDGALWLVSRLGELARYRDGTFQTYTAADGWTAREVYAARSDLGEGTWFATDAGAVHVDGGQVATYPVGEDQPGARVFALAGEPQGNLWAVTGGGGSRSWKGSTSYSTRRATWRSAAGRRTGMASASSSVPMACRCGSRPGGSTLTRRHRT